MVITANGNDISAAFYTESNYTFESNTLTVEREERNSSTVVTAAFPSSKGQINKINLIKIRRLLKAFDKKKKFFRKG